MLIMFNLAIFLSILVFASPILAQQALDPADTSQITINKVSTSGSGCPKRAVSINISNDRTVVTLGFDEFQIGIGRGFSGADSQKNCEIHLNLHYPPGYSYAVAETTYHGYAQLDDGVQGSFKSEYIFADEQGKDLVSDLLGGLLGGLTGTVNNALGIVTDAIIPGGGIYADGDTFQLTDTTPIEKRVTSPCDGQDADLLIRTTISLSARNSSAEGSLMDEDATFALTQQVHVVWEKCG